MMHGQVLACSPSGVVHADLAPPPLPDLSRDHAPSLPAATTRKSIRARWHEEKPTPPPHTFKEYWDSLPPLRPVPGRTRSLQLPVYRRGHHNISSHAQVHPPHFLYARDHQIRAALHLRQWQQTECLANLAQCTYLPEGCKQLQHVLLYLDYSEVG